MDNRQSKILISVLAIIYAFLISATGFYVMSYVSEFSFPVKWLIGFIFSTPGIVALLFVGAQWRKKT